MITDVLTILYFFVPAYVANMAPVFIKSISFLDSPMDLGSKMRGKRLFGDHKTWRGLIFGTLAAAAAFWLQSLAHQAGFTTFSIIEYPSFPVWLGAAIGFGALIGDALESAVKRQLDIGSGQQLIIGDQLDFMVGAMIVTIPYWIAQWVAALLAVLAILLGNLIVQRTGYWLGLKDDPL